MTLSPIHYRLSFPRRRQHVVDVDAFFPTELASGKLANQLHIVLPVWTPGSYLIREYARHIESIAAFDAASGENLPLTKVAKNRWTIDCHGASQVRVHYEIYCREASVRTNWVEEEYGFLTGAATFLTLDDGLTREHTVEIESPPAWPKIACSLSQLQSTPLDEENELGESMPIWGSFARRARSFDELVDSPILLGDFSLRTFEVSGKTHYLASYGGDGAWDLDQAAQDCALIVAQQHAFWEEIPYPDYWFINLAIEGYGGLEHDNCTVLVTSHWSMSKRPSYVEWLGLVSHEFFHTWNVRRLRPRNLIHYDYGQEQYVPELWVAEGITSYFDDLFVLRAGLSSVTEYLGLLGKTIAQVEESPGRLVQSLHESSFDTWIKHYRPDENSPNSRISYYTKGAVIAFLLDVLLRKETHDRYSLQEVMRRLWKRHRANGYTLHDFETIASELVGRDLTPWFEKYVYRCEPIDYQEAFDWLGLALIATQSGVVGGEKPSNSENAGDPEWELGCDTTVRDGRLVVTRVFRDGPASMAGLQVDDEFIAFNGHRLPKENWKERLQCYRDKQKLVATIARRGRLMEVEMMCRPKITRKLQINERATPSQLARREAWLNGA